MGKFTISMVDLSSSLCGLFTRGWALAQVTQRRLGDSLSLGDELLAVTTIVVWKTNATGFRSIHIYNVSLKCWKTRLMISFSTILAACSPAQENVKARNGPVNDKHTRKRRKALQQSITTITQWMQTILYGKIIDNNYTMKTRKNIKNKQQKGGRGGVE